MILGTVGVPTIAIILLFALPFLDRRRERRLLRRPVALVAIALTIATMGVLTYKGATVAELAAGEAPVLVAKWTRQQPAHDARVQKGATIFAQAGCLNCHTYAGSGTSNLGAPDLTAIGKTNNAAFFAQYVANPSKFGNNVMPIFGAKDGGSLSDVQLQQVAAFLAASKGGG